MPESRVLLEQMIEDNWVALVEARDKLGRQPNVDEISKDKERATDQEGLEITETVCKIKRCFSLI